jgi:hypothetical protein
MDNTLINIRFIYWHLQLERDNFLPKISYNDYHRQTKLKYGWFSIHNFFGYSWDK